jgi:hypothetical protein
MTNIQHEMSDISQNALSSLLSALGEQLASKGGEIHLVVIGGSGLLAMGLGDRPTQDVDVVAFVQQGRFVNAAPFPETLQEAAQRVANDFGLTQSWLNHGPTSLLDFGLPDGFEDRMNTVDYGPALRVSFASRLDQIHLKLYAFADRREPRDEADLRGLEPAAEELTAAATWARTHNAPGPFDDELAAALRAFGVTDAGRDA